jgi:hypothetical protein
MSSQFKIYSLFNDVIVDLNEQFGSVSFNPSPSKP